MAFLVADEREAVCLAVRQTAEAVAKDWAGAFGRPERLALPAG